MPVTSFHATATKLIAVNPICLNSKGHIFIIVKLNSLENDITIQENDFTFQIIQLPKIYKSNIV